MSKEEHKKDNSPKDVGTPPQNNNLFLKKNITILNYSLLSTLGKVDKTQYEPEYVERKERAKSIIGHYKDMQGSTKKVLKQFEDIKQDEKTLGDSFIHYNQENKSDTEVQELYKKAGTTLHYMSEIRNIQIKAYQQYIEKLVELEKDSKQLLDLKEQYRVLKLDHDQKLTNLNQLKKSKAETFKIYTATKDYEQSKKEMDDIYLLLNDELKYHKKRRDVEYQNEVKTMISSYKTYFEEGLKIINSFENHLKVNDEKVERKKVITKEDLQKNRIFGVELDDLIEREGVPVPSFLLMMFHYLKKNIHIQGIFRISGEQPEVDKLRRKIDEGDYNIDFVKTDIHIITSLFKSYFRQLPYPLITYKLYSQFLEIDTMEVSDIKKLVNQLPKNRKIILLTLLELLYQISTLSDVNKMNAMNLGICWGNNILRSSDPNPLFLQKEQVKITKSLEILIKNYPLIISDEDEDVKRVFTPRGDNKKEEVKFEEKKEESKKDKKDEEKRKKPLPTIPPKLKEEIKGVKKQDIEDIWEEHVSHTGETYWYNPKKDLSVWEKPKEL